MARILYFPGCEPPSDPGPPPPSVKPPAPAEVFNTWEVGGVAEEFAADYDLTAAAARGSAEYGHRELEALTPEAFAEALGAPPAKPGPPVFGDPYVTRPEGWELWMHDPPQHQLTAPSVEEEYDRAETMHNLYAAIEALPEGAFDRAFKTVVRHRLGLDGDNHGNPETLDRIGQRIGKSRSTVQQIEEQAERNHIRHTFAELEYGRCPRCGLALYAVRWWGILPRMCPLHGQ